MPSKTLALAAFTAAMMFNLISGTAQAQPRTCADHNRIVERLAASYGETRQSIGIASDNTVVEVFASLETGTWTIVITRAGGPSCLVASGEAFQIMADALPNMDKGA